MGLETIEAFLNTVDERTFRRHGSQHVTGDLLTSSQALAQWLTEHGLPADDPDPAVAIALRTGLRRALTGTGVTLADYPVHLAPDPAGELRLRAGTGREWLDALVETVAVSVARGDWKRIKLCAAEDCRWAFHDTSRSGRGRWCDMEVCGNRHKTRTYRERRHSG